TVTANSSSVETVTNTATATFSGNTNSISDIDLLAENFGHFPDTGLLTQIRNLRTELGARNLTGDTYLGATVPIDSDGVDSASFTAEATDDGVNWTGTWTTAANGATMDVTATCPTGGTAFLSFWIDANQNLAADLPNEQIFSNKSISCSPSGTVNSLTFTLPA